MSSSWESIIRKTSIGNTSSSKTSMESQTVRVGSIEGSHSIGESSRGSSKGSRLRDDMDRGRGLDISVDRSKSSMLSLLCGSKGSRELSLSSKYLWGVLNRKGGGNSQERSKDQSVHVTSCSSESSELTPH